MSLAVESETSAEDVQEVPESYCAVLLAALDLERRLVGPINFRPDESVVFDLGVADLFYRLGTVSTD